ncbi:MAG: hydroxyacylglutathione hydrolase [Bacteroidota bacterium]|nr:hydroxyacylglutathione hydrolase [Bacteroidota bacterium]
MKQIVSDFIMEIIPIEAGPIATNCYVVFDENSSKGVIIDTPPESVDIFTSLAKEKRLTIDAVLLTHSHWDHTADAAELNRRTKAPIFIHKADEYRLIAPMEHTVMTLPFEIEAAFPNNYLKDGALINCGKLTLEVIHTPGHTEGGVCFVERNNKVVFVGDTLFFESIGRVDLPGGSMLTLLDSIKSKLLSLPDDFIVHCGHGPDTTIGYERKNNPFLNGNYYY